MSQFTPEQIEEFLQEFFNVVGRRQYVGARYVPLFGRKGEQSIEWDNSAPYEPVTVVLYQGNSFTSRQYVPAGVAIDNEDYWAETGNFNGQVEEYRRMVLALSQALPESAFSAENTVKDYIDELSSGMDFYEVSYGRFDRSNYTLVKIPNSSQHDSLIKGAVSDTLSPNAYAIENASTFVCNAGMNEGGARGVVIRDGVVVNNEPYPNTVPEFLRYIDFGADGQITEYSPYLTASQLLEAGATNCVVAYYRLVENGVASDFDSMGLPSSNLEYNPRMAVFQNATGDTFFIAVNGRTSASRGMRPLQLANLCIELGAVDAWNLDGGGSTSMNYHAVKLNSNVDENGTKDRFVKVMIEIPNNGSVESVKQHYKANAELMNYMQSLVNPQLMEPVIVQSVAAIKDITESCFAYVTGATDAPTDENRGFAISIVYASSTQVIIWIPYGTTDLWVSRKANSVWGSWSLVANTRGEILSDVFGVGPTSLPTDTLTDLDYVLTPGTYVVESATAAAGITNMPTSASGLLTVKNLNSDNFVRQTFETGAADYYVRRVQVSNHNATAWTNLHT